MPENGSGIGFARRGLLSCVRHTFHCCVLPPSSRAVLRAFDVDTSADHENCHTVVMRHHPLWGDVADLLSVHASARAHCGVGSSEQ